MAACKKVPEPCAPPPPPCAPEPVCHPCDPPSYNPPPYYPPPSDPPPSEPGNPPPAGSASGLGLQVGLDVDGALDGADGLLDVALTNNEVPLIEASVDGDLDGGPGGVITVEAPALIQNGPLQIDIDAEPSVAGGDGVLLQVEATNDGETLLGATVDDTLDDGPGGVVTLEAPALTEDGALQVEIDAATSGDGDGALLQVTASNDGETLLDASVDGALDDGAGGLVTIEAPALGQDGDLALQVEALQEDADLSVGIVDTSGEAPQTVLGPVDVDLSEIAVDPLGASAGGGETASITDDLVSGALGSLTSGTPVLGSLLEGEGDANLLQVTGDLVGDALAAVAGGTALTDSGGELLGAILSSDGDGGALAGIDVGQTLDMLTSAVDLFDVPALDSVLDGVGLSV